jgi:type I restriction enzyme S subunit
VDKKTREDENPVLLCNYTDVYYNEYITESIDFMQASANDSQIRKFKLEAGDTIITKDSETPKDIAVPAYVPFNLSNVICGYHLAQIKPNEELVLGEFIFRCFQSFSILDQYSSRANGITRFGLTVNAIGEGIFPIPPIEEQLPIIRYIKSETSRLDQLITNKQRLTELLQERRQVLITQAVTKGLDLNVPMKDSGVEWLGKVPVHWQVSKLGYAYDVQLGKMLQNSPKTENDFEIPYLKAQHVQWENVITDDLPKMWVNPTESIQYGVDNGDLLVCEGGEAGRTGIVETINEPTIIQNALHRIRSKKGNKLIPLMHLMRTIKEFGWFDVICNKATIQHLTREKIVELKIPIAPLHEQNKIIDFLNLETSKLDQLISKLAKQISLLEEYRQTLITNAVTGKIDVRGEGN